MKRIQMILLMVILFQTSAFAEFPAVKVYEKTSKDVVLIIAKSEDTSSMIGAGSIISDAGLISTNAHVVIDKATSKPYSKIRVYLKPDRVTGKFRKDLVHSHKAEIVAYNIDLDLAILRAEDISSGTGTIELANPDEIKIGEEAVAIGHPEQGGLWTLTYGRISGEIDDQNSIKGKDVFQTDASVNRGNSGGPLLDKRGYMIGINSNMARLGAGDVPITGVNFAVKASVLKNWLQSQGIAVAYGKEDLYGEDKVKTAGTELEMEKNSEQPEAPMTKPAVEKAEPAVAKPETPAEKTEPAIEKAAPVIEKAGPLTEKKDRTSWAEDKKPETKPGERYQPYQKAYRYDDLLKAAEEDLEDMIEEMRGKIRR